MNLLRRLTGRAAKQLASDESSKYPPGSWQWLVLKEQHYGGMVTNVKRLKVSDLDPRSIEEIKCGGMTGGDRMFVHGYGPDYSRFLNRHSRNEALIIAEVGILKGSGLAIWSDLFPRATLFGLDIDPTHFEKNLANLVGRGAFDSGKRVPQVLFFDQFSPNTKQLAADLQNRKIDIVIDDGFHSHETIQNTLDALSPLLASKFTYFIEDNPTAGDFTKVESNWQVYSAGELTVITRD
jgi:hypothetical protein